MRWAPIPIAGGAILLVALDLWKKRSPRRVDAIMQDGTYDMSKENLPQVKGPWQVHVIGALPLRTLSRIYGSLNEYTLPVWFRVPGFKLYAWIFGVNLEEAEITDLKQYRSLSEFFMRRLKDGARPVDDYALVSPADGRVVNFGYIENRRIQQVKGVTYSLDSFLSGSGPQQSADNNESHIIPNKAKAPTRPGQTESDNAVVNEQEFANLNGLSYTVDQLVGNEPHSNKDPEGHDSDHGKQVVRPHAGTPHDASVPPTAADHSKPSSVGEVEQHSLSDQISLAAKTFDPLSPHWTFRGVPKEGNAMYFCVIYLAPGDYHRFHSPTNWVVERRRHFAGELFSVSPYMSKLLKDLFILNERVALLGRWRHGFFSMTPGESIRCSSMQRIDTDCHVSFQKSVRQTSGRSVSISMPTCGQTLPLVHHQLASTPKRLTPNHQPCYRESHYELAKKSGCLRWAVRSSCSSRRLKI